MVDPGSQSQPELPDTFGQEYPYYGTSLERYRTSQDSRSSPSVTAQDSLHERFNPVSSYYLYFHSAHPFLPPRQHFEKMVQEKGLTLLEIAVKYIGSCFIPSASQQLFMDDLNRALNLEACPRDGFVVQALLLLALGLNSFNQQARGAEALGRATNMALEIGMHQESFASANGNGCKFLIESWRRTWWEIYCVDGLIGSVHQKIMSTLSDVQSDVLLPSEERDYALGKVALIIYVRGQASFNLDLGNFIACLPSRP